MSGTGTVAAPIGVSGPSSGRDDAPQQVPVAARVSTWLSVGIALVAWLALLGPFGELLAHISPSSASTSFHQRQAFDPLLTSLTASAVALALIVALGTPLAWMLARRQMPLRPLWQVGLLIPLLMPPLVVGLLLIYLYGPRSPLGELIAHIHLSATNTFLALVIAEVYEAAPYYVLGAQSAFAEVDPHVEQAAALLGHRPPSVFRRVTLPLAAPGLATSLAFSWARAIGAFGAVVIIAYHPYGLPMQIWLSLQDLGLPQALPYALVLVLVALPFPLAAFAWASRVRRRV